MMSAARYHNILELTSKKVFIVHRRRRCHLQACFQSSLLVFLQCFQFFQSLQSLEYTLPTPLLPYRSPSWPPKIVLLRLRDYHCFLADFPPADSRRSPHLLRSKRKHYHSTTRRCSIPSVLVTSSAADTRWWPSLATAQVRQHGFATISCRFPSPPKGPLLTGTLQETTDM